MAHHRNTRSIDKPNPSPLWHQTPMWLSNIIKEANLFQSKAMPNCHRWSISQLLSFMHVTKRNSCTLLHLFKNDIHQICNYLVQSYLHLVRGNVLVEFHTFCSNSIISKITSQRQQKPLLLNYTCTSLSYTTQIIICILLLSFIYETSCKHCLTSHSCNITATFTDKVQSYTLNKEP